MPCWRACSAPLISGFFQQFRDLLIFDLILVGNQQVAPGAIAAGVIEVDRVMWVDMDGKRYFLLSVFAFALWAVGKAGASFRGEVLFST